MSAERRILLGNAAIGLGLLKGGADFVTSYPGTPSSEILPSVVKFAAEFDCDVYTEWSVNEKVAYDNALAAAYTGRYAAVVMKQVGLNVAADSLMSSAYTGLTGALVVVSCDDPGPHSSQTEQDSRFFAMFAKVPAFDPCSPSDAVSLLPAAFEVSHRHQVPVVFRPALRVCHAKQDLLVERPVNADRKAVFQKDPGRWAATPRYRFVLHKKLNAKLAAMRGEFENFAANSASFQPRDSRLGVIASGVPYACVKDLLDEFDLSEEVPVLRVATPYPLPTGLVERFMSGCRRVLLLEETMGVMELQIVDKSRLLGRHNGRVPLEGEMTAGVVHEILRRALDEAGVPHSLEPVDETLSAEAAGRLGVPLRRPSLCPGCPHRAAFYAIRKALPKAIFTSDIGCYTLGINLGAVDTCLDMGAAVTLASGFYHSFARDAVEQPIVATIGDSTFYHSGPAGLLNAVYNDARFVLVVLDNSTTAMTGMQPTPGSGLRADGSAGNAVPIEDLVRGCGVKKTAVCDPYNVDEMVALVKEFHEYVRSPEGSVAVIIARHPCIVAFPEARRLNTTRVVVTDDCNGCRHCIERFECPALEFDDEAGRARVNENLCAHCGVCLQVCPRGAIVEDRNG